MTTPEVEALIAECRNTGPSEGWERIVRALAKERDELAAEFPKFVESVRDIARRFDARVTPIEQERDAARAKVARLRSALVHADEWLDELGCDCGTDEPGTCAFCDCRAALAETEG